ncbi:hypothetical protein, partial [Pseudomonas sp. RW10S2]|uniref:hypothetical protein n=1 Tax=Pseudomonas sp. RW10S2 TaxID=459637 RepID=UPI001EE37D79
MSHAYRLILTWINDYNPMERQEKKHPLFQLPVLCAVTAKTAQQQETTAQTYNKICSDSSPPFAAGRPP